jgi:hypothetical protein
LRYGRSGSRRGGFLQAADEPLDAVAHGVEDAVDRVLHAPVLLGRYLGRAAPAADVVTDRRRYRSPDRPATRGARRRARCTARGF